MRPTTVAFALLTALLGACASPEGDVYWACRVAVAHLEACGDDLEGMTPEYICDRYDLTYCRQGGDEEACEDVLAVLEQVDEGADNRGIRPNEYFSGMTCSDHS